LRIAGRTSMKILKILALRGPNLWANFPVLEAWVDLESLKDTSSESIAGFNERLTAWLPSLIEHRCSVGRRGGFLERLARGTYMAHILEHVTLELQSLAGTPVGYGKARESTTEGVYKVVVRYREEDLGRECLQVGLRLLLAAVHDKPFDMAAELAKLKGLYEKLRPDAGTAAVVAAAKARGIPHQRLGQNLFQLGWGRLRKLIDIGSTERTSAVADSIAHDRTLTADLLAAVGVPVAEGRLVDDEADAREAAEDIGLPVSVRRGYGSPDDPAVTTEDLNNPPAVAAAYRKAREQTSYVRVERHPRGQRFRLLAVGSALVSAVSAEGTDVTASVHDDTVRAALDAAGAVGLDIAEIELIAADITRPLVEQCGAVIAVRAKPQIERHLVRTVADGKQAAAEAIVSQVFPNSDKPADRAAVGRIPVVAVTGVNGKTTTTRLVAHLLSLTGKTVGMTCTEGVYFGKRRLETGDCSGPASAGKVLGNPSVDAAVLETARGGILRAGLAFDKADVAIVTNIGEGDHLGLNGIDSLEQLAPVKRCIIEVVHPDGIGVLNAGDLHTVEMAPYCSGKVVFFGRDPAAPAIVRNRKEGGRAVFARDNQIVLAEADRETVLMSLDRVPLTHAGRIGFQVENVLAAVAAAWHLAVPAETIRRGLESFSNGLDGSPGRFNLLECNGAVLVVDYGHNPSALYALIEGLDQLPHHRRGTLFTAAGDRRDIDVIRQGEILGDAFDRVVLYEDSYLRGRKQGEISGLFKKGLATGSRVEEIEEIIGWKNSMQHVLNTLRPGELWLIQADRIDETVDYMRALSAADHKFLREISLEEAMRSARTPLATPAPTT